MIRVRSPARGSRADRALRVGDPAAGGGGGASLDRRGPLSD